MMTVTELEDVHQLLEATVPQQSPITVRQVMTHTAGFTYSFMNATPVDAYYRLMGLAFPGANENLCDMVAKLAKAPLLCQPGSAWNYSVASDVLGRLVEVWSGCSLSEFFNREIFAPLAMSETDFYVKPSQASRLSHLYGPAAGGDLSAISQTNKQGEPALRITAPPQELESPVLLESGNASTFLNEPVLYSGLGVA